MGSQLAPDPEEVSLRLRSAGIDDRAVVCADPPDRPDAKQPPEGPWLLVPYGQQVLVGALGRGKFAPYEAMWTAEDAVDLAVRLAGSALPPRSTPVEPDAERSGLRTAEAVRERVAPLDGAPGPARLVPGDALDCFGVETGHHLYALGTPFPQRSQPPSDVGAPYFTFEVVQPFPDKVREGIAAPWFEQPGGGAMIVLDRPIRWYVDQSFLVLTGQ